MDDKYLKEEWILACIFFFSAILVRFLPNNYYIQSLIFALVFASLINLLSFLTVTIAAIQRKRSSGIGGVSIILYVWFLIASNYSLVSIHETRWQWILLFKPLDTLILWAITYLCNFPARFQPTRHDDTYD